MNKFFLLSIPLLLSCSHHVQDKEIKKTNIVVLSNPPVDACLDYNTMNSQIRDGQISKRDALKTIQVLIPLIKSYYYTHGGKNLPKSTWIFPLQNYNPKAIGGKDGNGYTSLAYDYFDGDKHAGHPAQDIFINDTNQDCLDDKTKKPVNVLSMTEGIVIAISTQWSVASNLHGGKYIYIFQPLSNSFFYYAHNETVLLHLGDIVKPGEVIATVGRTGLNAFKKRSPTHLHIMLLTLDKASYPKPRNSYKDLLAAQTIKK